jgi:uncharacterized protein (DUF2267 family)
VSVGALGALSLAVAALVAPESPLGRTARRLMARAQREYRHLVSSAPGIAYRLTGSEPDPDVSDAVLADRIRSALGPLERRLDLPHIHVMVQDHVAILHGDASSAQTAARLEQAVLDVSGVRGVESHLHRGLIAGDTRPSEGFESEPPSAALQLLIASAHGAGASNGPRAVHAVLCGFGDRIPPAERAHLVAHLPDDVCDIMRGPTRHGDTTPRLRTVPQLVAAVVAEGGIEPDRAAAITRAVLATLRTLVPEETHDISAVLPAGLAHLWNSPAPASRP